MKPQLLKLFGKRVSIFLRDFLILLPFLLLPRKVQVRVHRVEEKGFTFCCKLKSCELQCDLSNVTFSFYALALLVTSLILLQFYS